MSATHAVEGCSLWFLNSRVAIRRASGSARDGMAILESWMPYGDSAPLHVHHREDEIFHIIEGVVRLRLADHDVVARAGETVVAPKGVPHTFLVESEGGAHCLVMARGGDFEGLVRDVGRPAESETLPVPTEPTAAMEQALAAAAERRRITVLGSPLSVV